MWIISLRDINSEKINKQEHQYIDMTDFNVTDYEKILLKSKPIIKEKWDIKENVTILDLFNIPYESADNIIDFIKNKLWIDINTDEWIKKINFLLEKAITLYEKRYLRKLPIKIKKLIFKDSEWIINFIKETKTNKRTWILNCAIMKISYAIDDVITNEKIRRAEFIDKKFIERYLEKPFQIIEEYEKNGIIYKKWKVVIIDQIVDFKLISRPKSEESIEWKQISDPKYYSIEEFKDLVGVTIYTKTSKDTLLLLQYLDWYVFKSEAEIDNKNWINKNDIQLNKKFIRDDFLKKIPIEEVEKEKEKEKEKEDKWKWTSDNYKEIKLKWDVELPLENWEDSSLFDIWTEIKFVIEWQDNEKWLSLHSIYDYAKRFRELTRLWLPIRELDILNYVNDFFENIEEKLEKKNKEKDIYLEELFNDLKEKNFISKTIKFNIKSKKIENKIAIWLFKYFKSLLLPLKIWNCKKPYYFHKRALALSELWLHKPMKKVD